MSEEAKMLMALWAGIVILLAALILSSCAVPRSTMPIEVAPSEEGVIPNSSISRYYDEEYGVMCYLFVGPVMSCVKVD